MTVMFQDHPSCQRIEKRFISKKSRLKNAHESWVMIGIVIMIEYWGIHVVGKGTWKKREVEKF